MAHSEGVKEILLKLDNGYMGICCTGLHLSILSGRHKLKQQLDTTTHLLEWPKPRTLTAPIAGKDIEQQKFHSLLMEMQNGIQFAVWRFSIKLNTLLSHHPATAQRSWKRIPIQKPAQRPLVK